MKELNLLNCEKVNELIIDVIEIQKMIYSFKSNLK